MKNILRYLLIILFAFFAFNVSYLNAEETLTDSQDEQEVSINNESSEKPKTIIEEVKEQEDNNILVSSENNSNASENEIITENQNDLVEVKEEEEITEKVENVEEENKNSEAIKVGATPTEEPKEEEPEEEEPKEEVVLAEEPKEEEPDEEEPKEEVVLAEEPKEEELEKEEPKEEVVPAEEEKNDEEESEHHTGEVVLAQTVKTIITKVDEEGNPLAGAKLQVINSAGKVVDEWTSDGKEHIVMLPDGTYKLHEVEAPEGYDLAEDKEFTIKIEVLSLNAGVDVDPYPCDHYQDGQGNYGVMLYYVEIDGKKHEVYCINQELGTPDQNSVYDGEILNKSDIRNFTTQTIKIDAHYNEDTRDISDQSLSDQELYDKLLDIIYHRHKAISTFSDLTESEIRYVTEMALKNYTNTGLTQIQRVKVQNVPNNYDKYDSYVTDDGIYVWYLYPMYRSFVYLPDAAEGEDIFTTSLGDGNSFGNLARHWNGGDHNAKGDSAVRQKIARYYELYNYLINDENGDTKPDHPNDMNLYIYSTKMLHTYVYKGVEYTEPYQNLLGITGYFEEYEPKEEKVEMVNKYSTKKISIPVKKIWNDGNNQDGKRPDSIEVTLKADGHDIRTATLDKTNNWNFTFIDLPVYEKGKKITYSINEVKVPEYETKIVGFTITNTYVPETRSIPVVKIWEDKEDYYKLRPQNVTIILYADDEPYDTVTLSKGKWRHVFENLPVYNNGQMIKYRINEVEVPEYYTEIEGTMDIGFTVTNTHFGEGGDVPKTLDSITYYILLLAASVIGLIKYSYSYVKNN